MESSKRSLVQVRYKSNSEIGKICRFFKDSEFNASFTVRLFIKYFKGYEFLKATGASAQERREHCLESIQYFASQLEKQKAYLAEESRFQNDSNLVSFSSNSVPELEETKVFPVKKNPLAQFLPK